MHESSFFAAHIELGERKKVSSTQWELKLSTFMTHFLFSNMHFLISSFDGAGSAPLTMVGAANGYGRLQELVTVLFIACSFRTYFFSRFHHFSFRLFAAVVRDQRSEFTLKMKSKNAFSGFCTRKRARCTPIQNRSSSSSALDAHESFR